MITRTKLNNNKFVVKIVVKICDKTRRFQSETHNAHAASRTASHTASHTTLHFCQEVEVIVNEKTYIKLKVNPTENLEHHINELQIKNYFSRYKYQLSCLAKISKYINGQSFAEENVFHKWVKSDFNHNHTQDSIHNTLLQKVIDEQLEGSGFVLNCIVNVVLEIYKVNDNQASSWGELPEKYKNNKSIINMNNNDRFCFLWCILAYLYPVEENKNRSSNHSMHMNKLNLEGLEFPMKVKDIHKFENLNKLNVNVFELTNSVRSSALTPILNTKNYLQPQIDLPLFENHYCLITRCIV